jgi:hypothetical protein
MTDELQLLFIASQYRLGSDNTAMLHELVLKEEIDWIHFFLLARRHKVFPRVWNNISITLPSVIPDGIKEQQNALVRRHTLHCMSTVAQLCSISNLLDNHNVVYVPYKGPVLACYLFDDFAMRSYGDLDILVSAVDLPQVYAFLTANGYTSEVVIPEGQLSAYASVEDNLTFMSGQGVPIEIHWELSGRYLAKPIGLEYMLSWRFSSVVMQDRVFKVFSSEHHLLYLCLHGTKHCWAKLDLIACLAELLLKETEIAWDLVFQVAEEYKCRRMVYIGLLLAQKVYCIELPDVVQTLGDEDKKALCWCAKIFDEIKAGAQGWIRKNRP